MTEILTNILIMLVGMVINVFLEVTILNILFNFNIKNKSRVYFALVAGFIITLFKFVTPTALSALSPLLFIILFTVYFSYICKIPFLKSIIASFLIMTVSIPIELVCSMIAFKILELPSNNENVIDTIPIMLIISFAYLSILCVLFLLKNRKAIQLQFNNRLIGINIALITILFAPNFMFYTVNKYNYPLWLLCYNILANIILVVLAIYNTYKHIKLEATERDLQNSEMHNKSLNELVDSIRVFKHDYNNVVHAIGGYIVSNDMDGLKDYYQGLAKDSKRVNQLESISPDKINEPSIYGILASKYQTAESKHIEFNFESMINYKNLDMPIYDFCKILGVLLDNAIEAAEETEEKQINVSIRQSSKTGVQLLSIENTYLNKDIDTEKIYEKGYSNKNRNSGLGLWEVKNIVKRNKNVKLITSKDDKYFKQELYIKYDEKIV